MRNILRSALITGVATLALIACGRRAPTPSSEGTQTTSAPERIDWHPSADCRGDEDTRDECHTRAACERFVDGTVDTERVEAVGTSDDGTPLRAAIVRRLDVGVPGGGGTPAFVSVSEQGAFQVGQTKAFSYQYDATPGPIVPTFLAHATVQWGPAVRGAREGDFHYDGTVVTGNIDGRVFDPFALAADPATVAFVDGKPSPKIQPKDRLGDAVEDRALQRLEAAISNATNNCRVVTVAPDAGILSANGAVALHLSPMDQDLGHFSGTYSASDCNNCKLGICGLVGAGGATTTVVACIASFGIACGAAIVVTAGAVTGCIYGCEASHACCPVACGNGTPSTCCFGDETCLNGNGLCCSADKTACQSFQCCDNGSETCMSGGCCSNANICGSHCCSNPSQCINGSLCCDTGVICGQPGTQTCCPPFGQCLSNGQCCPSKGLVCGDQCCGTDELCQNGVCVPKPTCPSGETQCGDGTCCGAGTMCCLQISGGFACVTTCTF
jgi:hypothetical protein